MPTFAPTESAPPSRGDIVVFRLARTSSGGIVPFDQIPDPAGTFIKRIIGIPGDSIRFGATLYVNGERKTGDPGPETLDRPAR